MDKLVSEIVVIDSMGIPHTQVYTEAEMMTKFKIQFAKIRKDHPTFPIRARGTVKGKPFSVQYGDKYDFNQLILAVNVKTENGSEITYICRKHNMYKDNKIVPILGTFTVTMMTKNGPKQRGININKHPCYKTDEQMMNLMNEGNFDRFRFIEDVIV